MEVRRQQLLFHLGDTAELIPIGEEESDEEFTRKDIMDAILKIMAGANNLNNTRTGVPYRDGRARALEVVDVLRTVTKKFATESIAEVEARKNNTFIEKAAFSSEERRRFNAMTSAPAIPANVWNLGLPAFMDEPRIASASAVHKCLAFFLHGNLDAVDRDNARKDLSRKEAYLYQGDRKTVDFLDTLSDVCDAANSTEREIRDHVVEFSCNVLPPSMMNKCLTQQEFAAMTFGDTTVGNAIPTLKTMRERLVEHETRNNNLARSAAYNEPTVFVKQQKAKSGRGVKAVNTAAKRKGLIRAIAALDLDNNHDYNDDDDDEEDTRSVASVVTNGGSAIQKLTQEIDQMKDQFRQVKASMMSRDEMKEDIKKANDDQIKSIQSLLETQMSTLAVTVANQIADNMRKEAKERNEKNKLKMEANQNKNKATRRCWKCNVMGHIPADNVCKPEDVAAEDGERNQPHNHTDTSFAQPRERKQLSSDKSPKEQTTSTNDALVAVMQTLVTVMSACMLSPNNIPHLTQPLYSMRRDTNNSTHGAAGEATCRDGPNPGHTGQHCGCTVGVQTEAMGATRWERQPPPTPSDVQTESSYLTEGGLLGNRKSSTEVSGCDHRGVAVTRTRSTNYEQPSERRPESGESTPNNARTRSPVEPDGSLEH